MSKSETMLRRGALLVAKSGETSGDMYLLVREAFDVYAHSANGTKIGGPKQLFNLVNLTNSGKTRVSTPERKLEFFSDTVPLSVLERHFNMTFDKVADNINEVSGKLTSIKDGLVTKKMLLDHAEAMADAMARYSVPYLTPPAPRTEPVPMFFFGF